MLGTTPGSANACVHLGPTWVFRHTSTMMQARPKSAKAGGKYVIDVNSADVDLFFSNTSCSIFFSKKNLIYVEVA